jgi:flagellar motor switch/type III secretory pathway protein FliN
MGTLAAHAAAVIPWGDVLPRLGAQDVVRRRRMAPAVDRLQAWAAPVAEAMPRVFDGLWPLTSPGTSVLRITLGVARGERPLTLDRFPVRIGRGDACALQLPDASVSTEHAEIRVEQDHAYLMDLRSTNGTKKNGETLKALTPVPLVPGDRVEVGPFHLTVVGLEAPQTARPLEMQSSPLRPRAPEGLFLLSQDSDRWVRVRFGAETAILRVPAAWMRSCWERVAELPPDDTPDVGPMEEGAAQFVIDQAARALSRAVGRTVELAGWLTRTEAERVLGDVDLWLESDVWLRAGGLEVITSLVFPVPEAPPAAPVELGDLTWPATVCVGMIRLKVSDWRQVEPGDALIPDAWWPSEWLKSGAKDLGPAFVRIRGWWHGGRLLRSETGATLRLENPWLRTPGGSWLMAEEDSQPGDSQSLPLHDLELQVAIELSRFPVTVGELQRWRVGEILNLRQGPDDPVRLVVETGLSRRVLAEGRVVVVNGKLGIEIQRILTSFQDTAKHP